MAKRKKVKIFNSLTNQIEECLEWAYNARMKANHVKTGGIFCEPDKVGHYFKQPPVIHEEKTSSLQEENISSSSTTAPTKEAKSQEGASNGVLQGAKSGTPEKPVSRRRGRPKSTK